MSGKTIGGLGMSGGKRDRASRSRGKLGRDAAQLVGEAMRMVLQSYDARMRGGNSRVVVFLHRDRAMGDRGGSRDEL